MPFSVNVAIRSVTIDAVAAAQGAEQVAVGDQAQPLVPRVVRRVEVRVDVDAAAAASAVSRRMSLRAAGGTAAAELVDSAVESSTFFHRTIG